MSYEDFTEEEIKIFKNVQEFFRDNFLRKLNGKEINIAIELSLKTIVGLMFQACLQLYNVEFDKQKAISFIENIEKCAKDMISEHEVKQTTN